MSDADVHAVASAHVQATISRKRSGMRLTDSEVFRVVDDFVHERIADYQMSAWLATVACTGLDLFETAALTRAYVDTGRLLDLSGITEPVVDKHSTGGVGDNTTMIVAPMVAACGVRVAKLSGRGLGHAGGTVDKLESIPGLRLSLTMEEIAAAVKSSTGLVLAAQSADMAPGDAVTYALRDVTATVESAPLIAASIISKKIAVGADVVILDVKYGTGGLLRNYDEAVSLARLLVQLGDHLGLRCEPILTDMNQPLGRAVGNALEVKEALEVLGGSYVRGLSEQCYELASIMLRRANPGLDARDSDQLLRDAIDSGEALSRFIKWATSQGANPADLASPSRLPTAGSVTEVRAERAGWLINVDARKIGTAALRVGAGRHRADSELDHSAGLVVHHRVGDRIEIGTLLVEIHHNGGDIVGAVEDVKGACVIHDARLLPLELIDGSLSTSPDFNNNDAAYSGSERSGR